MMAVKYSSLNDWSVHKELFAWFFSPIDSSSWEQQCLHSADLSVGEIVAVLQALNDGGVRVLDVDGVEGAGQVTQNLHVIFA